MLRLATRAPGLGDPPSMRKVYRLGRGPARPDDRRGEKVIGRWRSMAGWPSRWANWPSGGRLASVVKGLVKQGAVREEDSPRDCPIPGSTPTGRQGR
jgi:primosomal protein N' (replication factor Y)